MPIGFIYWINFFNIYYEYYFIIIWLLFSIKYSTNKYFMLYTKYLLFPILILSLFLSFFIIILEDKNAFNIPPEETNFKKFLHMTTKMFIVNLFQMYVYLNNQHLKKLKDKEIKREIEKKKKEIEKKIEQDFKGIYVVKPLEVFFKIYFILLDIFVAVFFYLSLSQKINLFNQIVLICVISFLIISQYFKQHLYKCLWILTISFLLKYTIYMLQLKDQSNFKLILDLLFNDDLTNIYYYWISYYLLFLEYIGQTSKLFKICKSKRFSVYKIIEYNLFSHPYIQFIFNTLFNFIFGIYIWLLIPCFLFSLLIHDNNCICLFQLTILFIIYYKYIKLVNSINFNSEDKILLYTKILIFTNVFNLIIEYVLQILSDQNFFVQLYLYYPKKPFIYKMELFGFFIYKGSYTKNLLSFFMMFILSLALHLEIQRQYVLHTKNSVEKAEFERYSLVNAIKKFSSINELEPIKLNDKEEYSSEKNEKKQLVEKAKTKIIISKIFTVLFIILHYYWIIIFIFVAYLSIHWMLSISMIIQLSIFSFYMGKSFNGYYKCLKSHHFISKNGVQIYNNLTLNEKIKLYIKEKKDHFKITYKNQHSYYNLIWVFTFSFIILSYLNSITVKYLKITENFGTIKEFISAISYFLGVYSEPMEETNNYTFWSYTWGYFIIIGLFSIRTYLMSKFAEIKIMYFNEKRVKNKISRTSSQSSQISTQSHYLEMELNDRMNKYEDLDIDDSFNMSFYENIKFNYYNDEDKNDLFNLDETDKTTSQNLNNNKENEYQDFLNGDSHSQKNSNELFLREERHEKEFAKRFKGYFFKQEYIEFIKEEKKYKYFKDDISINYKKNIINKNFENSVSFQIGLKKFMEIF